MLPSPPPLPQAVTALQWSCAAGEAVLLAGTAAAVHLLPQGGAAQGPVVLPLAQPGGAAAAQLPTRLAVSPDGRFLAAACGGPEVRRGPRQAGRGRASSARPLPLALRLRVLGSRCVPSSILGSPD